MIELKVSRGYDRVIGQLLRYMAWIKVHQAEQDLSVRGMIVAREISEDLQLACSSIPDVELFEYELSVTLRKVVVCATPTLTVIHRTSDTSCRGAA